MKFSGKMFLYDNIKSHKKPGFQPLIRRYIFRKTTGGGVRGGAGVKPVLGLSYDNRTSNFYEWTNCVFRTLKRLQDFGKLILKNSFPSKIYDCFCIGQYIEIF